VFSSHDETVGREERIGEIIACYLDACEAGEAPNQQEILARHPEFENELKEKEYFTNEAFVRGVFSPNEAALLRR